MLGHLLPERQLLYRTFMLMLVRSTSIDEDNVYEVLLCIGGVKVHA